MRRVASSNEFFDILDKIGNGKFVTIGYVTGANLDVPTVSRRNPLTNRMKKYPDYSVFGADQEIGALVKITSYNIQYLNRQTVGKKYGEYKQSANGIRANFGLDPIASKESYKQGTDWSPNGPELYKGQNTDLQSHSYNPQNIYNVKPKGVVYAVNNEGHIIKELTPEQVQPYLKAKREVDGVAALRKMGAEEERIQDYIAQINNLKFKYINFESNSILWIAATINGEKIVYINDNLARAVDGIDIRPEDFRAIARERYQIDLANLQEMASRKSILRLTESELKGLIRESVISIVSEAINPIAKIQELIQQANAAYHNALEVQGASEKWPLMDKEGTPYGLSGDVRLDGRGYIVIPFTSWSYGGYSPERIRVLTKAGGKIRVIQGDYMESGWKDARKMLNQIIRDAQTGNGYFQNYDPNWESTDTPEEYKANKSALKAMNKSIGMKSNVGTDYITKNY